MFASTSPLDSITRRIANASFRARSSARSAQCNAGGLGESAWTLQERRPRSAVRLWTTSLLGGELVIPGKAYRHTARGPAMAKVVIHVFTGTRTRFPRGRTWPSGSGSSVPLVDDPTVTRAALEVTGGPLVARSCQ